MLRTDATKYLWLLFLLMIAPEHICSEDSIVNIRVFGLSGRFIQYPFFETNLFHHSLFISNGNLILNPDYASCRISKTFPPWKIRWYPSRTYPSCKNPGVLTTNWYAKKTSYFIFIPQYNCFFLRTSACLITPRMHFILRESWQAENVGTGQFGVDLNLGAITVRITVINTSLYINFFSLIIFSIIYIVIPSFQLQVISHFCGADKVSFS